MFTSLRVFATAHALADHAARSQGLIARNVANADTPGFRAQRLEPFSAGTGAGAPAMRATRPAHLSAGGAPEFRSVDAGTEAAPNGNTVSVEEEMLAAAGAQRAHQEALLVYRHALGLLRGALGRS